MKFPLFVALLALCSSGFAADLPRVLPPGELPHDARLGPLKELDGYFPFNPPETREAWTKRAEKVRLQIRVALGLWPEPTRTPLNAVIQTAPDGHGEGYTVENVYFESMPGFFVTGSLFRPTTPGLHPAVLCPHGHWTEARFNLRSDAEMKKELESGAEFLPEVGRNMFQSLGVQFARMGVVAFVIDMIGYCDSQQISFDVAHKFAKQRPEMNTVENWGLFSPQAEAHAQSILGLQTWNNIRALDFLTSLPDVDSARLGCTGASGGGTQTMMLAALDARLAVVCPAVMVSTAMQGGCTCENASLLRVGTGNVEIAALFAPKPLGMTAANDWTKEMETKGFPDLKKLYTLLGVPQNVALWPHLQFGHNYNAVSRANIYAWFNEHFYLGLSPEQLVERDFKPLTKEQLTVWNSEHPLPPGSPESKRKLANFGPMAEYDVTVWDPGHPAPPGGPDFERKLLKWWSDDAQAQMAKSPEELARIATPVWQMLFKWPGNLIEDVANRKATTCSGQGKTYPLVGQTLRSEHGEMDIPIVALTPKDWGEPGHQDGRIVIWLDEKGKAGLFDTSGEVRREVCRLVDAGFCVIGVDLFEQGEFLSDGQPSTQTRRTKNPREAGAYTFGYNPSLFAQRVQDIFQLIEMSSDTHRSTMQRYVIALDGMGPLAVTALAMLPGGDPWDNVYAAAINTGGFRFGKVLDLRSPNFVPALAKYGDLPIALKIAREQTQNLLILGEGEEKRDPIDWLLGLPK